MRKQLFQQGIVGSGQVNRVRKQKLLRGLQSRDKTILCPFVQYTLMGHVLVHEHKTTLDLTKDVFVVQLPDQSMRGRFRTVGIVRQDCPELMCIAFRRVTCQIGDYRLPSRRGFGENLTCCSIDIRGGPDRYGIRPLVLSRRESEIGIRRDLVRPEAQRGKSL